MAGYIKLWRDAFDHPLLRNGDRFRAFMWLVSEACWKGTKFDVRGKTITLHRGQLCVSREQLADAWKWSPSAVERFLARLKTEQMIERSTGQGKSVITILNYDKYQDQENETGQPTEQQTGQKSDRNRTAKEEGKEGKKEEDNNYRFSGRVIKLTEADFAKWESSYSAIDLSALLQSRDDWLAEEAPPEQRKKWFTSTSNWLASKQQQATAAKGAPGEKREVDIFWG
jgi:hypothetical protein